MANEEFSESIIDDIVTLPTIPTILAALNDAIQSPDSSAADVGDIISRDPPTTTKVLRLANSAYYGLRSKVTTISHAVTMLGFNIIRNLVLTATVFDFSSEKDIAGLFNVEDFWNHSLGVGVAAKIIAGEAIPRSECPADEFFICGLLHDLGKIIFSEYLPEKFEESLKLSRDKSIPLFEAETTVIGCNHADVGGLLAKRWSLSAGIISAVGYHHSAMTAPEDQVKYAAVTHIADIFVRNKSIGSGGGVDPKLDRETWDALGLDKKKIPEISDQITNLLAQEELPL